MRKYFKWLSWRRVYCKIVKQEGSPESIARGLALGLFVGFAMPMGGQMIVAIPLAFLLKANKVLAVMGTVVTNPYTSLFIYPVQCWFGAQLMGAPLNLQELKAAFRALLADPTWAHFSSLGSGLIVPFFIGGFVFAVLSAVPTYYLSLYAVRAYRRRRALKRAKARVSSGSCDR